MLKGRKEFEGFREEVREALKEVAEKYNFNIEAGKIKYTDISFDMSLSVTEKEVDGKSYEVLEFEKYCNMYGLKSSDYGKKFTSNGKIFTLSGFKPRATKLPVIAKDEKGQGYKFTVETVKRLMA